MEISSVAPSPLPARLSKAATDGAEARSGEHIRGLQIRNPRLRFSAAIEIHQAGDRVDQMRCPQ